MTGALIEDGVIRLRPLDVADAASHLAGCDQVIIDRLGAGEASTPSQVAAWLGANASAWAEGGSVFDLGVEETATDRLAGCVGIQRGLDYLSLGQVNLTYAVYAVWRGRGLATRAVRLAMEIARQRGHVTQFVIRAAPDNVESIRVAERLGFKLDHVEDDGLERLQWHVMNDES